MFKKYSLIFLAVFSLLLVANPVLARDPGTATDWYIKNFDTSILVNKDSSLLVTENIIADASNLPDKHGIFRVLPTQINTDKGVFKTPIELVSITDFAGNPYHYQTNYDSNAKTVTYKIGDANVTVTGEHDYKIVYKVSNAVRFANPDFDELYWNLLGSFWALDIDNLSAKIIFPSQVTQQNTSVYYYAGSFGSKETSLAQYKWIDTNTLLFTSTQPIRAGEGITVSVTFPKHIFTPYQLSFLQAHGDQLSYLFFLIPMIMLGLGFWFWLKFGKDPKMRHPLPPEFGIPSNITPMQLGVILKHGSWDNKFIAAAIIDLAVKKYITIKEVESKILFVTIKDYTLSKAENYKNISTLTEPEKLLLSVLFENGDSVTISSLKKTFAQDAMQIRKLAIDDVILQGWISKAGNILRMIFLLSAAFCVWVGYFISLAIFKNITLFLALELSALVLASFGFLMSKRTQKGVDMLFKIKGFELYMKQAEDYRQQFYEKENIFDKFLPYAMVFGITKLWVQKMEKLYGKDFYTNYHPVWFIGGNLGNFDANTFSDHLNGIVIGISNSVGTASGAGGGGFSGGGGGGGGGGGW